MKRLVTLAVVTLMLLGVSPMVYAVTVPTGSATVLIVNTIAPNMAPPPPLTEQRAITRQNGYQLQFTYSFGENVPPNLTNPVGNAVLVLAANRGQSILTVSNTVSITTGDLITIGAETFKVGSTTSTTISLGQRMTPVIDPGPPPLVGSNQLTASYAVGTAVTEIPDPVFTPLNPGPNGPGISITIPNDFPVPSNNAADPGFVSVIASAGVTLSPATPFIYGRTLVVYFTVAAVGDNITITYGNAANGFTMPPRPNRYTFNMQTRFTNPTGVGSHPYPQNFQTLMPSPIVNVLTNMTPATLVFNPNTEYANCQLDINFQIGAGEERSLLVGDRIQIQLDIDPATNTPIVAPAVAVDVPLSIAKEYVKINNTACSVAPIVTKVANNVATITVFVPQDIRCTTTTGRAVNVTFDKRANIRHGASNGSTIFSRRSLIRTRNSSDTITIEPNPDNTDALPVDYWLLSNAYQIGTTIAINPRVDVVSTTVDQIASYTIGNAACGIPGSFQVGPNGTLQAGVDTITVEFPAGTKIPTSINPASITVQVLPGPATIVAQQPQINGQKVTFVTPINIPNNGCMVISFATTAQIQNPSVGDWYYLKLWTSKEPTMISSDNYHIENPGWATVAVDPNISFTDNLTGTECSKYYQVPPPSTGVKYVIQFSLSESCQINTGGTFTLIFPPQYIGCFPTGFGGFGQPLLSSVTVNNVPPQAITIAGTMLVLQTSVDIPAKSQVTVIFTPAARILNPDITNEIENFTVRIQVPCQAEIVSQSYQIKTEVSNVTASIVPPSVSSLATWSVEFCLGDYGDVGAGLANLLPGDNITISFPDGVIIPSYIPNNTISLDVFNMTIPAPWAPPISTFFLINPVVSGQTITATLPNPIPSGPINENTKLRITFPLVIGIRNPAQAGYYFVTAKTSRETTPVPSNLFTIGTVVTDIGITVTPNTSRSFDENCVSGTSEFTIRFRLGQAGSLSPGDLIQVQFPVGFIAGSPLPVDTVILNGVSNNIALTWASGFFLPVQNYISAGSIVEIIILKSAGVINPWLTVTPKNYMLQISTTREPAIINSLPFELVSKICMNCNPGYSVNFCTGPANIYPLTRNSIMMGAVEGWWIGFQTGDVGTLTASVSTVTIEFPAGTSVPTNIPSSNVRCLNVGSMPPDPTACYCTPGNLASSVSVSGQKVTIIFPITIPAGTPAWVYFCSEANIAAPMIPGEYKVNVWTSSEVTPVASCNFTVLGRGMAPAKVYAEPSTATARNVMYTVEFNLGPFGGLSVGDTINIDFRYAGLNLTSINPDFSPQRVPSMYVTVNGTGCILPINYEYNPGLVFHVQTPVSVPSGGSIKIVFSSECRIQNPTQSSPLDYATNPAGPNYSVFITTNREIRETQSEEYEITNVSNTTRPYIINNPCVAGLPSVYTVSFYAPVILPAGQVIRVRFPTGFYLPSTMQAKDIKVNGYLCTGSPLVSGLEVQIPTPVQLEQWKKVTIEFDPSLMLYNPTPPGTYQIWTAFPASIDWMPGNFIVCEQVNICRAEILPSGQITVPLGGTQGFTAKVFDCQGQQVADNLTINWSFGSDIGYISPLRGSTTNFTAYKKGEGVLLMTATYGNKTLTATANIIVTGRAASILITPGGPITLVKNLCYNYTAQLYDDNNPPHAITTGVTYEWSITDTSFGNVIPTNASSTTFCPAREGSGAVVCKVTYDGIPVSSRSDFTIKSGIYSLYPLPTADLGQMRIGQLSPELLFELRNDNSMPIPANENIVVTVESSSPTGRFSSDKLNWTVTNKTSVIIVKGFTRTESFYFSDSVPGNVSITAFASNINPTFFKITLTGPSARVRFTNEPRVSTASASSPPLTLSIKDEMGQTSAPSADIKVFLSSYKIIGGFVSAISSTTGSFSASDTAWSTLSDGALTMRAGQTSIDFFYRNTEQGNYLIKANSVFYGQDAQEIIVTAPGSVSGNLLVSVEKPVAKVASNYTVDFRVGAAGALIAGVSHIYLEFPEGTDLPSLTQAEVRVNSQPCQVVPIVDKTNRIIDIIAPTQVQANKDVRVEIPRIVNPSIGTYSMRIWTSTEPQPATSQPYMIGLSSVTKLKVTVRPDSVGLPADYVVEFRTGPSGVLGIDDIITIQFPVGTVLPSNVDGFNIRVNGIACTKVPQVQGLQLTILNPMPIQAEQDCIIEIDAKAGIKNPPIPKTDYVLKLMTKTDPKFADSIPYEIKQASTVTEVKVQVVPPTASEKSKYTITFKLGASGTLLPGDEIYIQMNDQILPTSIASFYVNINGVAPSGDVIVDGKRLKIKLATGLSGGQTVVVVIEAGGNIKNPATPGSDYRIAVFTNKEPYPVNSESFTIESSVVVTHTILPPTPNGEHTWYITQPTVRFDANISADIYISYDDNQHYQVFSGEFRITKIGQNVIWYKAKSKTSGVESAEKMVVIKYDPDAPVISITSPGETTTVKDTMVNIIGKITDINDVELTMNGSQVALITGSFTVTVNLVSGVNIFNFSAKDFAGNMVTKKVTIVLKNKPPVLTIDEPTFLANVTGIEFPVVGPNTHQLKMKIKIKGTTEPGIAEVVITPITVPGGSQTVKVGPDGKFESELTFDALGGMNELKSEVSDSLGNKATYSIKVLLNIDFRLQKDNDMSNLNGLQVQLVQPAYIVNGRTMVPFRIMAEAMGAKVSYTTNPTSKLVDTVTFELGNTKIVLYIGKTTATVTVNGLSRTVKLDSPAVIKKGTTMVPFRFVAENLGAKVSWDNATKTARMVYP